MKTLKINQIAMVAMVSIAFTANSCGCSNQKPAGDELLSDGKMYYAWEVNGLVCGYTESLEVENLSNEKKQLEKQTNAFLMLSLLGSEFNNELNTKAILNTETRRASFISSIIKQGPSEMSIELEVKDGKAVIKSPSIPQPIELEAAPETIIGSDELITRLKRDFLGTGKTQVEYEILELLEASIQTSSFRKVKEEQVELVGKKFSATVIEQINSKSGLKTTYWISDDCSTYLMLEVLNRKIYLSKPSVIDRIKVANVDMDIFTRTNVSITDVQSLAFVKVKVAIEPMGQNVTKEELSVPGQIFSGTVTGNRVEGIFEISKLRYIGEKAPAFPQSYNEDWLQKYLVAESRIESDNPVLVAKAKEITKGAKSSWEAATRLSKWVSENIHYALPGGGTAIKTYEMGAGECGSQSFLLTAFGRAVGIPVRVVWGAVYTPNYGGGFGQHAWNEVYMGTAGWIPIDASAGEFDYVNAGHIRIAEYLSAVSSLNGKTFEVIEYKLDELKKSENSEDFSKFLGKYINIDNDGAFEVVEKEGSLAVDIPNKMTLTLKEPDEKGRRFCKLIPSMYYEFMTDEGGNVNSFQLHELSPMKKKSSPEKFDLSVPDTLKPYLGTYVFAMVNKFTIDYQNGTMVVDDPTLKKSYPLTLSNDNKTWVDKSKRRFFNFSKDQDGTIATLTLDVIGYFVRGEFASAIVEKTIRNEGIESGLLKYKQLKEEKQKSLLFTEGSFNSLGYKFLAEKKFIEAIEIFKLLVAEYPDSFNAYDSLGEAYMLSGNKEEAVKNYEKSLELNPQNENGKKMLKKLKKY